MRRTTLIDAVQRLTRDLDKSGVAPALDAAFERFRKDVGREEVALPLEPFKNFAILYDAYDEATLEVARIFQINDFVKTELWQQFFSPGFRDVLFEFRSRLRLLREYAPRIVELLRRDHEKSFDDDLRTGSQIRGQEILTVTLVEKGQHYSSPARIIHVFEAVSELYGAIALMQGRSDNDLTVLACDSGSDKSFDFLGFASVIKQLRLSLLQLWHRVVFSKQMKMSVGLEVFAQSLPILAEVDALKHAGTLSPEAAEQIKQRILSGATKFLETGCFTDDMEGSGENSPRLIMQPQTKLLAGPTSQQEVHDDPDQRQSDKGEADETDRSSNGLSADDIKDLQALLKKSRQPPKRKP